MGPRYVTAAQSLIQIRVGPLYWLVSHYTEKRIDKYSFSNTCTCIAGSMFTNWNSKIRKISEIPGLYLIFIHCKIRSVLGCFLHEYTVKFVVLINQFKLVYVTMKNLFSMYNLTLYRKMQVFFFLFYTNIVICTNRTSFLDLDLEFSCLYIICMYNV